MSLLCRFGRHRPRGIPRWNDGYYFAVCARCGADLVRTAFQRWHVPEGYRVVWSDRPPASRPEVALMPGGKGAPAPASPPESGAGPAYGPVAPAAAGPPEPVRDPLPVPVAPAPPAGLQPDAPAAPAREAGTDEGLPAEMPVGPAAGPGNGRLPIQDVLARLQAEDSADRAAEAAPAPAPAPAPEETPARHRRSTWDFMDDDPFREAVPSGLAPPPRAPADPAAPVSAPRADPGAVEAASSDRQDGGSGERGRRVRLAIRNFWSGPGEPRPILVVALAMAVAVAVALALALQSGTSPAGDPPAPSRPGGEPGAATGEEPDPFAADAGVAEREAEARRRPGAEDAAADSPADRAFVAASLLSCRAAPALQSRRVRNLARGQEVRVLSIEGEWASLAYRGGQCWAQARFISPVPPL